MAKRYKNERIYSDMLKDAYEWVKDAEKGLKVRIEVQMRPSERRGVWTVEMVAFDGNDPLQKHAIAKVTRTWPNSLEQSYDGAFFQQTMALCRILDQIALDRPGLTVNAPLEG